MRVFDALGAGQDLESPSRIQAFLDAIPYSTEPVYRSPLRVLRDRRAHCFDGAVFAAAALGRLGQRPLMVDLIPNERDDDHVVAPFRRGGWWGAVAKSNFAGLRYREPVYRGLRELIMSYFEDFYNVEGEKTLRAYTVPLDLGAFDRLDWLGDDAAMAAIAAALDRRRRIPLLRPEMVEGLAPVDQRSYQAGMLGSNAAGLWKPDKA